MTRVLEVGISTCPNDTFAFAGLLEGEVRAEGIELAFELADVEELNGRVLRGELDVAKVSFHAALLAADELWILSSGAALGRGVGPLLLARGAHDGRRPNAHSHVLCPGRFTTASLLYALFHPNGGTVEQVVFSEIMPRLAAGRADFGVCIHEGRFTWRAAGLSFVEDLGASWERETGVLLPLGGIAARRTIERETARALADAVRRSIAWARAHEGRALAVMRRHAVELSDEVLWAHVELYVNATTLELGDAGREALEVLSERAREQGILPRGPLEVA